jgi:hypothetical protein
MATEARWRPFRIRGYVPGHPGGSPGANGPLCGASWQRLRRRRSALLTGCGERPIDGGDADSELSAIASRVMPSPARRMISADLARAVGARPLYLPSFLAFAMPSRCLSSIISRSNWATAPKRLDEGDAAEQATGGARAKNLAEKIEGLRKKRSQRVGVDDLLGGEDFFELAVVGSPVHPFRFGDLIADAALRPELPRSLKARRKAR